jgi:hypothetical protein
MEELKEIREEFLDLSHFAFAGLTDLPLERLLLGQSSSLRNDPIWTLYVPIPLIWRSGNAQKSHTQYDFRGGGTTFQILLLAPLHESVITPV